MHLLPPTLDQWMQQRKVEAAERGYKVVFAGPIALFFNGPYLCYTRTFNEPRSIP